MTKKIHIAGNSDLFHDAISDRLARAGAILTPERNDADLIVSLDGDISADISVLPAHVEGGSAKLCIRVHDLLIPDGINEWGPSDIHEFASMVRNGETDVEISDFELRHWLHVRDATDALSLLIMANSDSMPRGVLDMSGRRAWGPEEIIDEMTILWDRFTNALNHAHTTESLSAVPSPVRNSNRKESSRPDLGPLNSSLRKLGTDGWHPLVPMRVALMEILAHAEK
ncbi:MAG: hypothetical protein CMB58_005425 [Methanobacteriota archaeon]|nr:MAG: hypothetical protein CMB58_005425 [Euryarchaeota archaeon]|tara:strand:- start:2492 stop:3172 length:681 start_codon:yes stop_codon:yes gene_type:complete